VTTPRKNPWTSKACCYNQWVDAVIFDDKPIDFEVPVHKLVQLAAAILDQATGPAGELRPAVVAELTRLHDEIAASFVFRLPVARERAKEAK